jgi:hypothetical protein
VRLSDARYFWAQLGRWSSWTMAHFDFAFPPGPVLAMQLGEPGAAFRRRFLIGVLENCGDLRRNLNYGLYRSRAPPDSR